MPTKTLKCRHCKNRKDRKKMITVPCGAFCNDVCAAAHSLEKLKKDREKQLAAQRSNNRKKKLEFRSTDLPHQISLTQKAFNSMIRELDKHRPCVSCGKPAGSYVLTAGHYLTVGSHPETRFNPCNCHGQCSGCNKGQQRKYRGDNATTRQKFTDELVRRYGQAFIDYLTGPHPSPKYTCDQLVEMRAVFSAETKRLQKGEPPSQDWRSIKKLRDQQKSGNVDLAFT